jgi:hypothetical protein
VIRQLGGDPRHVAIIFPVVTEFDESERAAQFSLSFAKRWIDSGLGKIEWPDSLIDMEDGGRPAWQDWQDTLPFNDQG